MSYNKLSYSYVDKSIQNFLLINDLKYSNTQGEIGIEFIDHVKEQYSMMDKSVIEKIEKLLPPPRKNNDKVTQNELTELLNKQEKRTYQDYLNIYDEAYNFSISRLFINYIKNNNINIDVDINVLIKNLHDIDIYIYILKKYHDRVRPTILMRYMNNNNLRNDKLSPSINVPTHPAYPSGHATQCKFTAQYLSSIDPKNEKKYHELCEKIASNRELAGLHYRSDTEAGYKLANILFTAYKENINTWDVKN